MLAPDLDARHSAPGVAQEAFIADSSGRPYRVEIGLCSVVERRRLAASWGSILAGGPAIWLDRDWNWDQLDALDQLAFAIDPEWLVMRDVIEPGALRDFLGVLVTTGPVPTAAAGLESGIVGGESVLWVEYLAIAPSIRANCPAASRREPSVKAVGQALMRVAIERSLRLGCNGRIALHAEGSVATSAYAKWGMASLGDRPHPTGGSFPVCFGSADWANGFGKRGPVT